MIICSPQLGLAPNSVLGGEVFDREILLGLAKNNIKVEILLPINKSFDKGVKNWNISFIPITHFPAITYNFLIIPFLFGAHKRNEFNIIRIHQPQFIGIGCLLFKIFHPNLKLVATFHQFGESDFGPLSNFINGFWDRIICDSFIVKSKIVKTYKVRSSKITVVHNGVPNYLRPSSKDKRLTKKLKLQGKIVLLFMGLFIERKNPLFLLEILSRLVKTNRNLLLIFWGKGPLESKIMERADQLGIKNEIRIQKPVYGNDKNKIHNLADIFVHPSLDEGFALAPLEAMACAKPIVITSGFSSEEAVKDGYNGFLCKSDRLDNWTRRLDLLIKNQKLRKKMGLASLARAKKEFQWSISVNKHIEVFEQLLNETT